MTTALDSSGEIGGVEIGAIEKKPPGRTKRAAASRDDSPVGQVLRTVYQRAVDEAIPAEMLDLLSKLD